MCVSPSAVPQKYFCCSSKQMKTIVYSAHEFEKLFGKERIFKKFQGHGL